MKKLMDQRQEKNFNDKGLTITNERSIIELLPGTDVRNEYEESNQMDMAGRDTKQNEQLLKTEIINMLQSIHSLAYLSRIAELVAYLHGKS